MQARDQGTIEQIRKQATTIMHDARPIRGFSRSLVDKRKRSKRACIGIFGETVGAGISAVFQDGDQTVTGRALT